MQEGANKVVEEEKEEEKDHQMSCCCSSFQDITSLKKDLKKKTVERMCLNFLLSKPMK